MPIVLSLTFQMKQNQFMNGSYHFFGCLCCCLLYGIGVLDKSNQCQRAVYIKTISHVLFLAREKKNGCHEILFTLLFS